MSTGLPTRRRQDSQKVPMFLEEFEEYLLLNKPGMPVIGSQKVPIEIG